MSKFFKLLVKTPNGKGGFFTGGYNCCSLNECITTFDKIHNQYSSDSTFYLEAYDDKKLLMHCDIRDLIYTEEL